MSKREDHSVSIIPLTPSIIHHRATWNYVFACPGHSINIVPWGWSTPLRLRLSRVDTLCPDIHLKAQVHATVTESEGAFHNSHLFCQSFIHYRAFVWSPKTSHQNGPQVNFTISRFISGASLSFAPKPCSEKLVQPLQFFLASSTQDLSNFHEFEQTPDRRTGKPGILQSMEL